MFLESNPKPPQEFFELYSPSIAHKKKKNTHLIYLTKQFTNLNDHKQKQKQNKRTPLEPVKQEKRQWETQREQGNHNRLIVKQLLQRQTQTGPFQLIWSVVVPQKLMGLICALTCSSTYSASCFLLLRMKIDENGVRVRVKWVLGTRLRLLVCMCNGLVWDPSLVAEPPLPFPRQDSHELMSSSKAFNFGLLFIPIVEGRKTLCCWDSDWGPHESSACGSKLYCVCQSVCMTIVESIFLY